MFIETGLPENSLDAAETLAKFTVDGQLDRARFTEVIGNLIAQLSGWLTPVKANLLILRCGRSAAMRDYHA